MTGSFTERTGRSGYTFTHNVDESALRKKINEFAILYATISDDFHAAEAIAMNRGTNDPAFKARRAKRMERELDDEELQYQAERLARNYAHRKVPEESKCHQFVHYLGQLGYALEEGSLSKPRDRHDKYKIIDLLEQLKKFRTSFEKLPHDNRAYTFCGLGKENSLFDQIAMVLIGKEAESQKAAFFGPAAKVRTP